MKLRHPKDVLSLPRGDLHFVKDGLPIELVSMEEYAFHAAEAIVESGIQETFETRADVILFAMQKLDWGLAKHGYVAEVA